MEWISAKVQLPDKSAQYLCAISLDGEPPWEYACYYYQVASKQWVPKKKFIEVAYWMFPPPLPNK